MKIGILGCGNIASLISDFDLNVQVVALYDKHFEKAERLSKKFKAKACRSFDEFINEDFDTLLEVASFEAVRTYAKKVLENGKNIHSTST